MKRAWIRLYTEVVDDRKVQNLSPQVFKFWINCLCLAGKYDGYLPSNDQIIWHLRHRRDDVVNWKAQLVTAGLLDVVNDEGRLQPHEWKQRQYEVDVSTERVKQFRKRNEAVPFAVSASAAASVSISEEVKLPTEAKTVTRAQGFDPDHWPRTAGAIRAEFPAADDVIVGRIVEAALVAFFGVHGLNTKHKLSDADLADAVIECKRSNQESAGLYLRTVPEVIKTWAQPAVRRVNEYGRPL